jgi:hypothetical protein
MRGRIRFGCEQVHVTGNAGQTSRRPSEYHEVETMSRYVIHQPAQQTSQIRSGDEHESILVLR